MSDTVISFISICATILLGIIGFIANSLIQRKSNSIEIITKKRLSRRDMLQDLCAEILELSDYHFIFYLHDNEFGEYSHRLIHACTRLHSLLEFEFERDAELVNLSYKIKNEILQGLPSDSINYTALNKYRCELSKKMDIYATTEWQRIKIETVGTNKKVHLNWNALYSSNNNLFTINDTLHSEIFK